MSDILVEVESAKSKRLKTANKLCKDDIVVMGTGDSYNPLEYASNLPSFRAAVFPFGYELTLDVPLTSSNEKMDCTNFFRQMTGIKKITLKGNINKREFSASYMFYQSNSLEVLDIQNFNFTPSVSTGCFQYANGLVSILGEIDATYMTGNNIFGSKNSPLVDVNFKPNTISVSLNFSTYPNLSTESVDSIIDGLADLSSGTAQTLTVYPNIKVMIEHDPERLAKVTGKNWNLA